jgi:hypothetical protein
MTNATEWLVRIATRRPEALLVLIAGCVLMMRDGGSEPPEIRYCYDDAANGSSDSDWNVSRATQKASEVVTDLKNQGSEIADSVTKYAGDMGQAISTQTAQIAGKAQSTFQAGFAQLMNEQPLALIAIGLAAGAAVATLVPSTDVEDRMLAGAREAISERVGETLIEAASDAGERLSHGIADRASEGFKELVHEVAEKFTDKVSGDTKVSGEMESNISTLPNRRT